MIWVKRILGITILIVVSPVALGCLVVGMAIEGIESLLKRG